jgi:uncharacterized protein (UPF0179 family)
MATKKTACTSCGDIIDESEAPPGAPVWMFDGQPKCKDCYLELSCGRIVDPGQSYKPPHENLTPRQRTKLN